MSVGALTLSTFDQALNPVGWVCDLSQLRYIDAYGLVGTAAALRAAQEKHGHVELREPESAPMRSHLCGMGFKTFLEEAGLPARLATVDVIDAPDVVVPLLSARQNEGGQALSNLLWEQTREVVAPQVLEALTEGVWEMVENAREHSGSEALVMGQVYWPQPGATPDNDDRVQVVIGDTGRGILESFLASGKRNPEDDLEAIDLALEY